MALEKNIADAQDPESIILSILIRQFDWKVNDEHQRYGVIGRFMTQGERLLNISYP